MLAPERSPTARGWEATLDVTFARTNARTVIAARKHRGPLQVQRAFYPEGPDVCHLYVLHPPGGIVAGDRLQITLDVAEAARALVTTPAATKVYRSPEPALVAVQRLDATVGAGASFEWLPQETIVFEAARVTLETRISLAASASFLGWEVVCLGRPACGEGFARGSCRQRFELVREGRPLAIERSLLDDEALRAPWGMRGAVASGTLLASPAPVSALDEIRALAVRLPAGELFSASVVGGEDGVLVCRYLGASAARGREQLARVWALCRPFTLGRQITPPRIWST